MSKFKNLYSSYCNWVFTNPSTVVDIENVFTCGTVALCAKSQSQIWPELLYSASNLLILHNDVVILKKPIASGTFLKICLSVIEYCEVLFEIVALSKVHSKRMPLICLIQLIKCLGRLYLIKFYNEFLIPNPPFEPLNKEEICEARLQDNTRRLRTYCQNSSNKLNLGRSITVETNNKAHFNLMNTLYIAEIIFTLKPLLHLVALYYYGEKSWKPWLLSLSLDVISNKMHCEGIVMFPTRRYIIIQRYIRLLLYFLRSPLYEHILKKPADKFKKKLVQIPLLGTLLQLILNSVPKYRNYYFYLWSH